MKKNFKRLLILVLALCFILSAATTSLAVSVKPVAVDHKTAYKIDVFTMLGNFSGLQPGWSAKLLKDKFNISMNIISSNVEGGGDTKFATMMASGKLGDLVIFGDDKDGKYNDAIKAGFLYDWKKNGLVDKYAPYIVQNFPKAIQKNMTNYGNSKSLYGLGHYVADAKNSGPSEGKLMGYQTDLRFDIYQKIGAPDIKSWEDLLTVLKKMQAAEPKSESGKPTYGFTFWKDWDGNMMMCTKAFTALMGYNEGDQYNDGGFLQFSPDGTSYGALDVNGPYLKTLALFFKANQMGLVDPDSISQTYDDVANKFKDGQILFAQFPFVDDNYNVNERLNAGKGFQYVPIGGSRIISYAFNPYGNNRVIAIGAKAKYPERIMEFINWLYTPEGMETYYYGPKGLTWDLNEKGKPERTAFGNLALPNNDTPVPNKWGGGTYKDGVLQLGFEPIDRNSINPMFGEPYDFKLWTSELVDNPTKIEQAWRAKYKVLTPKDYIVKNNLAALVKPVYTGKAPETRPDTIIQEQDQVKTIIKDYSWKAIFAKNEAEFTSLVKEMIDKANGLGYKDVLKWNLDHAKQVVDYLKTVK